MPEAEVNGIRLYYEEHGEGAPIACIHGGGSTALMWADAVEELARLGRVIAYDRRGCTRSERPEPCEHTTRSVSRPAGFEWTKAPADRLRAGEGAWESFPDEARRILTQNGTALLAELGYVDEENPDAAAFATIDKPTLLVAASESPPEQREMTEAMAGAPQTPAPRWSPAIISSTRPPRRYSPSSRRCSSARFRVKVHSELVPVLSASDTRRSVATLILALLVLLVLITVAAAARHDAAAAAPPPGWLVQPKGEAGCVHARGTNRCERARAVTSPEDVVISPGGRHVYVAAYGSNAVAVFARNRRTGELEQLSGRRGCVRHEGGGSCSSARALGNPTAIALSADGMNAYVASAGSDALSVFARNRRTGVLRQLPGASGCLSQRPGGGCVVGRGLNEPTSVAVSPDGQHVYVTGRRFPSGVAILTRASDGSLTQPAGASGCVSHRGGSGCPPARGISAPEEVAVTPDSRQVLVAGSRSDAIAVLSQGPGGLSQAAGEAGCIAKGGAAGCGRARALAGPVDLALTPNGRGVYVASSISDAVAILRRDRITGALTQSLSRAGCISQNGGGGRCAVGRGLNEVWGVALSPDGRNVYAVSAKVSMLSAIARNRSTGRLAQLPGRYACFIRAGGLGCPEGRGLTVAVAVAVSRDGRNVYVASEDVYLGSIAVFQRRRG